MVIPLIPAAAAGLGIGAGFGLGSIFSGGSKKQEASQVTTVSHAPYETYAPTTSTSSIYSPSYQIAIESPYASQTKKDVLTSKAAAEPYVSVPAMYAAPQQSGNVEGTNLTQIAIIAAIGIVGYGLVSKK